MAHVARDQEIWNELKRQAPWLKAIDGPILTLLAVHVGIFQRAVQEWDRRLIIPRAGGVEIQHPLLPVMRQQSDAILKIAEVLGLTPALRRRLDLKELPRDDGWADITPSA